MKKCYALLAIAAVFLISHNIYANDSIMDSASVLDAEYPQNYYDEDHREWDSLGRDVKYRWDEDTLIISGSGDMYNFSSHPGQESFCSGDGHIVHIIIEDGINSVGNDVFDYCKNLLSVRLPDSITKIGDRSFAYCYSLKTIDFPNLLKTIGDYAFAGCNLKEIHVPSGVQIGRGAFIHCENLTSVILSDGVQIKGNEAFKDCNNLEYIRIPDSITDMGENTFEGCPDIQIYYTGTLDDWNNIDHVTQYSYINSDSFPVIHFCAEGQWVEGEKGRFYQLHNGAFLADSVQIIDDKYYLFDEDGYGHVQTGWKYINHDWYYFDQDGAMLTGWQNINNKWYCLKTNGTMKTGWDNTGENWYYLSQSGEMVTGWYRIGSRWYYFNMSGVMQTGWQKINGKWYYLGKVNDGAMQTGWQKINNNWYFFGGTNDGAMKCGWQWSGGYWYYLGEANDGAMKTGWQKINNKWYFMYNDGHMACYTWVGNYYVNRDGVWIRTK